MTEKFNDKQGWFIFGMCVFFITLSMLIVNYDYLDNLSGFAQVRLGIPISLALFSGAWMISKIFEGTQEEKND